MKRVWTGILVALGLTVLAGTGHFWNAYLRPPPSDPLPLSVDLIALSSPAGHTLLAESNAVADYAVLRAHFVPQSRKAYCGVASAVITLNAMGAARTPLDERRLFAPPGVGLHPWKVSFIGMSLRELGALMEAHGAQVTVVPASRTDLATFRSLARANLARPGDFLVINYDRAQIGQQKMGHISPVAAYHASSDRLLILDVAAHKYPPVWVPLEHVWQAMRAPLHPETTTTRGFLLVHGAGPALASRGDVARPRLQAAYADEGE